MDPRLKMQYYEDKKWKHVYITTAKRAIKQLWESTYKSTSSNIQASENEDDDLLAHIFKR